VVEFAGGLDNLRYTEVLAAFSQARKYNNERKSMPNVLFWPTDVLATADALRAMEFNEVTPQRLLGRHMRGDWGDLPVRERHGNEMRALTEDGKVTSRFRLSDGEIVEVTTDLEAADTLISQPGDDKHLARFAEAWRHPRYAEEPPGVPYYLVRISPEPSR
jgi:hypothetical protein